MDQFKKRAASVLLAALFCVLFGLSSFAATTNEYGLGLRTEQEQDNYIVTLTNQNDFAVKGIVVHCDLPRDLRSTGKIMAESQELAAGQSLALELPLLKSSQYIGKSGEGVRTSTAGIIALSVLVVIAAVVIPVVLLRRKKAAKAIAAVLAVLMLLPCFNLLQVNAWGNQTEKSFKMKDTVTFNETEYTVTVTVKYLGSSADNSYFETTVVPPVEADSTLTEYITSVSGKTVAAGQVKDVTYTVRSAIDDYEATVTGEAVMDGCAWSVDRFDLKPGDNEITVTSTLADGRTQTESYHLTYDKGSVYRCQPNEVLREGDVKYVNGLVNVFFKNGTEPQRADEIIHALGGVRIGEKYASDLYQARVKAQSLAELEEYCRRFEQFEEVRMARIEQMIDLQTDSVAPNDDWDQSNPTWDSDHPLGSNWSVTAVNAPEAWEYNSYMNHVYLGMVDSAVFTAHEDFNDLIRFADSDFEDYESDNINIGTGQHGTHVAGTMGAAANNGKGITGLLWNTNIYAANFNLQGSSDASISYTVGAVVDEILDGAKAVNLSLGMNNSYRKGSGKNPYLNPYSNATLDSVAEYCVGMLTDVLADGKEFVIVQSAGNGVQDTRLGFNDGSGSQDIYWYRSADAYQNGLFCSIQKKDYNTESWDSGVTAAESAAVYDRVIVVGAAENCSDSSGAQFKMWFRSNGGSRVDIYAPGVSTLSTVVSPSGTDSLYSTMTGTSQAAPIVTAVVGACFAINPELTGPQVKRIICSEANTTRIVADNTDLFVGTPASPDAELEYHPFTGDGRMINMELCVQEALRSVSTRANYTILNRYVGIANGLIPSNYTNFNTVQAILDVIDYNRYSFEQDIVDEWAWELISAINDLQPIYADYSAVDLAIAAANALNPSDYVSFDAVTTAVNAVKRGKLLSEQAAVDAMAQAIRDAISALVLNIPEEPIPETTNSDIVIDADRKMIVTTWENAAQLAETLTATQGYTVTEQVNENGNDSTGAAIVLQKAGCDDIVYQVAVLGDTNGDAVVDGFDAYVIGLYVADLLNEPQGVWFAAGDADCDGAITEEDQYLIERCMLMEDALINLYQPAE